ncbi:MAG: enoyl-CoA hydratase/isomerase family protein [Chloroflexi bacterium]|nr:enoyl-CoA hydratase/isomerase family protein [Chloroflexota bacterium]
MPNLTLEKSNSIARITLTQAPVNVIDIALMKEIDAAIDAARDAKVIVIGAQGKFFSAGVDVKDHTADRVEEMITRFDALIEKIWNLSQPTIAAVQGSALGGGLELAMACDFIVASSAAKFAQPEIQVGVFPPIAAVLLPFLISNKKAFEMMMTGDAIDAATAERLGLVNAVATPEEFENALNAFIARLMKQSGVVLQFTKRAARIPLQTDALFRALREIEKLYLGDLMKTHDANEGLAAFMEKREPRWKDE